tara:strand:- start:935 stop:1351 length:417 start_codon:yes stop_codon:yes gene_type:complete
LTDKISKKDKKDWENFLSNTEKLQDKELNTHIEKIISSKTLDLHGFSLEEANKEVEKFLNTCFDKGISKVVIITGKGLHSQNDKNPYMSKKFGILKYSVPEYIKNNSELMKKIKNISNAEIDDGGSGAFYIFLKKPIK